MTCRRARSWFGTPRPMDPPRGGRALAAVLGATTAWGQHFKLGQVKTSTRSGHSIQLCAAGKGCEDTAAPGWWADLLLVRSRPTALPAPTPPHPHLQHPARRAGAAGAAASVTAV